MKPNEAWSSPPFRHMLEDTTIASSKEVILLITPNDSLAKLLEKVLGESGYDTVVARNESDAIAESRQKLPSLIAVDRLQGTFDQLRSEPMFRQVPIITLQPPGSDCHEEECLTDLERGADMIICNQTYREIVSRIRAILRRQETLLKPATVFVLGGLRMDVGRHEVIVRGREVELTPKEFQILRRLLESPERAFSRQEILNRVWGEDYALEEHALDVHIHSLRHKIETDPSQPKYIVTVRGVGYKLLPG
ncbi:MAG: winged helix-turn-helix domain-containing protein [Nitrospiraceae bacterium]